LIVERKIENQAPKNDSVKECGEICDLSGPTIEYPQWYERKCGIESFIDEEPEEPT
jgi:hypothetical protein